MNDVVLVYPGVRSGNPRLPMSVLTLATYLETHGIECVLIDERLEELDDYYINRAKVIGISSMSGSQLSSAVKTAQRIRHTNPEAVVVWGGAHVSAFPRQSAESGLVDVVVRGEGEETFEQLCKRVLGGVSFHDIGGITYKHNGEVIDTPDRERLDIETLPFPDYSRMDLRKYADYEDGLSFETSRGCPFRCQFCYVEYFHHRSWRGKSAEKVISELEVVSKELKIKNLYFVDDNFFLNKERMLAICRGINDKNLDLKWSASGRADLISKLSDQEMEVVQKGGGQIISIGAESGSIRTLEIIKKDITIEQIKKSVSSCVKHGIMPTVSFMIGFPFENMIDSIFTIVLYDELMKMGKVEINGIFIYVPYAGTPLYEQAQKYGYVPRTRLEDWSDWQFSDIRNNPWLRGSERRMVENISNIARFKYLYHRVEFYSDEYKKKKLKSPFMRIGYAVFTKVFAVLADWRWKNWNFAGAYEWILWEKLMVKLFRQK